MFNTIWTCLVALTLVVSLGAVNPVSAEELSAEDHAEIHQLYARYVQAIDFGDAIAWADTFYAKRFLWRFRYWSRCSESRLPSDTTRRTEANHAIGTPPLCLLRPPMAPRAGATL